MQEVSDNLYVSDETGCQTTQGNSDWVVVHACKYPCHNRVCGNPPQGHQDYLKRDDGTDLYLNMVDMDQKQKHEFMGPMIDATFSFVDRHIGSKQVLIHCNQGQSRSPSLAMLYLAKRTGSISEESYSTAVQEFRELYFRFNPGRGIRLYLEDYWHQLE